MTIYVAAILVIAALAAMASGRVDPLLLGLPIWRRGSARGSSRVV